MEPLAQVVRDALDAVGMSPAEAARVTRLDRRHISQIINRKTRYIRPPKAETLLALERLPGLSMQDIHTAVSRSVGIRSAVAEEAGAPVMSRDRRAVHNIVDKFPEDQLPRVLRLLIDLLD